MEDLVRSATQQEMGLGLQRMEYQRELGVGEILHFVDDDEIVAGLGLCAPSVRDEVEIEELGLFQPRPICLDRSCTAVRASPAG